MKVQLLNNWLTFAANVGVIIGIVVLVVEINQNTRVAEVEAYQTLIGQVMDINNQSINNPDLRALLAKQLSGNEPNSGDERVLATIFLANNIRHGDMAYYQYERGLIDKERLDSILGVMYNNITMSKHAMSVWDSLSPNFTPEYIAYVNDRLNSSSN